MEGEKSIGAIWVKTAKSGKPYMTGNIEVNGVKIDIVVFSNDKGGNENRPDYRIFKSEKREQGSPAPVRQSPSSAHVVSNDAIDDIPF